MAMADLEAQMMQVSIEVLVVEDFAQINANKIEDSSCMSMTESLWSQMPEALVDTMLMFLPAVSQTRFQSVCKRWKEQITSTAFQKESWLMACQRGYPFRILGLPKQGGRAQGTQQLRISNSKALKVHIVDFLGLMIPLRRRFMETKLSGHGDLLALAWKDGHAHDIRCCLLNLESKTWQELPPLVMPNLVTWNLWLQGSGEATNNTSTFKVTIFVRTPAGMSMQNYSSGQTNWDESTPHRDILYGTSSEKCLTKMGYVICDIQNRLWRQEGNSVVVLPDPPSSTFTLLSNINSTMDALFGYEFLYGAITLYRLEEGRDDGHWEWKCMVHKLPLESHAISEVKIVGDMLLILVSVTTISSDTIFNNYNIVAYLIRDNSYKQLQLPSAAWRFFECNHISIVAPTTAQLGL